MPALINNKKARYRFEILQTWEVGLVLTGQEVKSLKAGQGDLKGSYVRIRAGHASSGRVQFSAELVNAYIPSYIKAGSLPDYDPRRSRSLLLKRVEMRKLLGLLETKGLTLVPLKVYTRNHLVKVQIGLARGKSKVDRRETIKKREIDREIRRSSLRLPQ